MAQNKIPIHSKTEGAYAQTEDWWTLIIDTETGEKLVEHEWSHGNPYKDSKSNEGTKTMSIDEFLKPGHNSTAQEKLKQLLSTLAP